MHLDLHWVTEKEQDFWRAIFWVLQMEELTMTVLWTTMAYLTGE